jgi:spore germination protein Q
LSQSNFNQYTGTAPYYGYQPYAGMPAQKPVYSPQQPMFPPPTPPGTPAPSAGVPGQGAGNVPGMLPIEQSYIENILRLNKGKLATVYATFEGNSQWNAKTFEGIIEAAGRDHLILSDPQTGQRYLIPMVYVDYVVFNEEIEYEYPFGAQAGMLSQFSPR